MKDKEPMVAFLGQSTAFEGRLKFDGTARIDGRFKGEIRSSGTLIVGRSGRLESEIQVGALLASGHIQGNIQATERIEIFRPAKILGNLQAPAIAIAEGVLFEGQTRMVRPAPKEPGPGGGLHGKVADRAGGRPLPQAEVRLKGPGREKTRVMTDHEGRYQIDTMAPGTWQITLKAKGRSAVKTHVQIRPGQRLEKDFSL